MAPKPTPLISRCWPLSIMTIHEGIFRRSKRCRLTLENAHAKQLCPAQCRRPRQDCMRRKLRPRISHALFATIDPAQTSQIVPTYPSWLHGLPADLIASQYHGHDICTGFPASPTGSKQWASGDEGLKFSLGIVASFLFKFSFPNVTHESCLTQVVQRSQTQSHMVK